MISYQLISFSRQFSDKALDVGWPQDFFTQLSIGVGHSTQIQPQESGTIRYESLQMETLCRKLPSEIKEIAIRACKIDKRFETMIRLGANFIRTPQK